MQALRASEVPLSGELHVEEIRDRAAFLALESEWNELVGAADDQVFYRHELVRIWIDAFAPDARLRVLVARDSAGRLAAALPLIEQHASLFGTRMVQLVSPANAHTSRCDLVALEPDRAADALLEHLCSISDWDLLRLHNVPEHGAGWRLADAARLRGLAMGAVESSRSPFLVLPESVEALEAGLKPKVRRELRRLWRRLEERGKPEVEHFRAGPELDRLLAEGLALEQRGWKGQEGTAVAQSPRTLAYYTALATVAAARGWLALNFLRVGGRAIAFDLGLAYGGRYLGLKPAYDESFASCGPGQLHALEQLRHCVRAGLQEFEFLGQETPSKLAFTSTVRPHHWLVIFRGWLGRAMCPPGLGWMPKAQSLIVQWAGERRTEP